MSRGSNKHKFAIKLFRFCDKKTQQPNILKEELSITGKEIVVLLDNLRDFLKAQEQAIKSSHYRDAKLKLALHYDVFAHCYKDTQKHSNSQIHLSFRFEHNNKCDSHQGTPHSRRATDSCRDC